MANDFTDLIVWQKAHKLTLEIYKITAKFPKEERYGLVSQLRRAAVSVEANIAESHGRYHYGDIIKFLFDSRGSIFEIQAELMVSRDVGFLGKKKADLLIEK
jgi:four helix bundle protein